ncbi:type VI secretion system effector, Hcp1 family [Candidatus Magnetomorum sp. HK-1]|nr:type VI secretion system effector, Hcp1 family [Candidatus Magnetomorum sp. HK-1]
MAMTSYLRIDGIEGSADVEGREGCMEIVKAEHSLHIPTDRKNGTISGARVHNPFILTKNIDKGSSPLHDHLCKAKVIPKAVIEWYRPHPDGYDELYYTQTLENARVVRITTILPDVDDPNTEEYKHREEIAFQYEKITWLIKEGNLSAEDSWKERKTG